MPIPLPPPWEPDPDALVAGAIAALTNDAQTRTLLGAGTVNAARPHIQNGIADASVYPRLSVSCPSLVDASGYLTPRVEGRLDVAVYTRGASTDTVRALVRRVLAVLVTATWAATGHSEIEATTKMPGCGIVPCDEVADREIVRGRRVSLWAQARVV